MCCLTPQTQKRCQPYQTSQNRSQRTDSAKARSIKSDHCPCQAKSRAPSEAIPNRTRSELCRRESPVRSDRRDFCLECKTNARDPVNQGLGLRRVGLILELLRSLDGSVLQTNAPQKSQSYIFFLDVLRSFVNSLEETFDVCGLMIKPAKGVQGLHPGVEPRGLCTQRDPEGRVTSDL